MSAESKVAEAMRLAAGRLVEHASISHTQARALEQPSGFGPEAEKARYEMASALRREADVDNFHAKTLKTLIREGAV